MCKINFTVFTSELKIFFCYFVQAFPLGDSEEDSLKRFQHITEITILTVQLIVEFSKRVPGFDTLSREDQITLLKVNFFQSCYYNYLISCIFTVNGFNNSLVNKAMFFFVLFFSTSYNFFY